jgi:hypothetical protein
MEELMKTVIFAALCLMIPLLSSCAIFVFDEEEDDDRRRHYEDDRDTVTIIYSSPVHNIVAP